MSVVTIRGQLGSGAPEIGRLVAERLKADYVDREIIAAVAERVQRSSWEIEVKEQPPETLAGRILAALGNVPQVGPGYQAAYLSTWAIPLDDFSYRETLISVIEELALAPAIVIRGRGSQFILKDHPDAFHVLTVAPLATRIARVMQQENLDEEAAKKEINRFDKSRRAFIRRYFGANLEDPNHYDLVINTGHLDFEGTAVLVAKALDLSRTLRVQPRYWQRPETPNAIDAV